MTELEKLVEKLVQDYLNGKIEEVFETITDHGYSRSVTAYLTSEINIRLINGLNVQFKNFLRNKAIEDYSKEIED